MELIKNTSEANEVRGSSWKTNLANYGCAIRPVVAIVAVSIDEFSSRMDTDERAGMQLLAHSRKLQRYYFEQFQGTTMVEMGGSTQLSFHRVEKAVEFAMKIQKSARTMFNHRLSIGIHFGEVRYVGNDIFGKAVSIASDIQKSAKAGQVLISEAVAQYIGTDNSIGLHRSENDIDSIRTYQIKPVSDMDAPFLGYGESSQTDNTLHDLNTPFRLVANS